MNNNDNINDNDEISEVKKDSESGKLDQLPLEEDDKDNVKSELNLKSEEEESINLEDKILLLEEELKENKDKALRSLAEAENTRRQVDKQRVDLVKYGIQPLARELLSVIDNFSRAMQPKDLEKISTDSNKGFIEGLKLTLKELQSILEKFNIKKIHPIGENFDPNLHQAMYEGESKEYKPGLICEVVQDGYMLHERLLRPALVGVSKKTDSIVREKTKDQELEEKNTEID